MGKNKNIIISYLKDGIQNILICFIFLSIFFIVFFIYNLPIAIFLYASIICISLWSLFVVYDFYKYYSKHRNLENIKNNIAVTTENLPEPETLEERHYQDLIHILYKDKINLNLKTDKKHKDLIEYYTLWTHQVKTPLSAIGLLLQSEDKDINQDLELQFFEVEKYVDMALQYLRIDSMYSDLRLEKYSIQRIVKKAIKSYSKLFIYKGISLDLGDKDIQIITDEKWLLFVIKQILSNSLKYTEKGEISIHVEDSNLIIKDTGIGIRKEDLSRIFERGFTGYSGRIDEKSTGLGLYLSKRILDNLEHRINISSKIDLGTKVEIDLSSKKLQIE